MSDIPFFNRQVKIVLRNSGIIDPLKIDEYIAREGLTRLAGQGAHRDDSPDWVVDEVLASGLRGRGGADALPTGHEVALRPAAERGRQVHPLQRRRGRPGRLHGPLGARGL